MRQLIVNVNACAFATAQTAACKVYVASKNPVKVRAVQSAIARCFPHLRLEAQGVEVESNVGAQPFGDDETLQGALNRLAAMPSRCCGLSVAIEGGVSWTKDKQLECFAWVVAKSSTAEGTSKARSASFVLPPQLARLVEGGLELGAADDQVFERTNSGRGEGTIGRLTGGLMTRQAYYEHAVVMAMVPFMNALADGSPVDGQQPAADALYPAYVGWDAAYQQAGPVAQ